MLPRRLALLAGALPSRERRRRGRVQHARAAAVADVRGRRRVESARCGREPPSGGKRRDDAFDNDPERRHALEQAKHAECAQQLQLVALRNGKGSSKILQRREPYRNK